MQLGFTPQFEIRFAKKNQNFIDKSSNITKELKPHVKSIRLVDEIEGCADKLTINLADPNNRPLQLPSIGGKIGIKLGYKETGLADYRTYTIEDIEFLGPPNALIISCTSIDFSSNLHIKRNTHYENLTLEKLASIISAREEYESLGLKQDIRIGSSGILYKYIAQTNESDLHLLKRISEREGADFSIKRDTITINDRNKTTLKKKYGTVKIYRKDISSYSMENNNRNNYSKVIAKWWNQNEAILEKAEFPGETEDDGVPFIVQKVFQDYDHAITDARGLFQTLKRKQKFGQITMPGKLNIYAGTIIELAFNTINMSGFRKMEEVKIEAKENNKFTVSQVIHTMDTKGWIMNLRLEG